MWLKGFLLGFLMMFSSFISMEEVSSFDLRQHRLIEKIVSKYKVSKELVSDVVRFAIKHEHHHFPKAEEILAIVGIESSWNENAVSSLAIDPAVGLTQIRPKIWGIQREDLLDSELSILYTVNILKSYYRQTKNLPASIISYNVGIGNFRSNKYNGKYIGKFVKELKFLEEK